jgi:hypothetical protein
MENEQTPAELLPLDALPLAKSDQLIGWIYSQLSGGKPFTVADWNRAVTELAARA